MSENMLTIDRLFDFGVVGLLDASRLSVIGVVRALSRAISDRLSDIGVPEESPRPPHPTEYLSLLCLLVVQPTLGDGMAVKDKRADFLGPLAG